MMILFISKQFCQLTQRKFVNLFHADPSLVVTVRDWAVHDKTNTTFYARENDT